MGCRTLLSTSLIIACLYTGTKANWQLSQVGSMLTHHRDRLSSSIFLLETRKLSRFVSGHSVSLLTIWCLRPPSFESCIQQTEEDNLSLSGTHTHARTHARTHTHRHRQTDRERKREFYCPACRTTLVATRFRVAVICPIIQVPHCIRVFFYFVWFVFINHIFQFYYELCTYCNILDIYLS